MVPRLPGNLTHPMNIGSGAFASVYRARQPGTDRWVAVKIIHEKDRAQRKSLLQEAKVQAQMNLGCVPHVYDAFAWGRSVCIIMEWIKGVPLSTLLSTSLTPEERLLLAGRFIEAVAALHAIHFAHRDLKPANVLVTPACDLYLVDFGFSKNMTDTKNSVAFIAKGTPAYMAPEVWERGASVDLVRADVFSAGKVLYDILGDDIELPLVKKSLQAHPDCRLPSGVALLDEWRSSPHAGSVTRDRGIAAAGELASELLATRLVAAARQLLFARRNDEAYWLLVEALEEDPQNSEAIRFMADFSRFSRTRLFNGRVRWATAAMAAVCIGTAAFFLGRHSGTEMPVSDLTHAPDARLIETQRQTVTPVAGPIVFRERPGVNDKLAGRIVVAGFPDEGSLRINGKKVDAHTVRTEGMELAHGSHLLTWADDRGAVRWKENVRLLPFETKIVPLAKVSR
ncbi:MAG: serine/threonine protein kinase [Chitinispirillaceae bacterium]|nr:serine/threonine protein kinase [Chitinispirillaceae bacterium]